MSDPLFSVVIPTYNRAHLLPRAVESVLAQDFDSYELIVVDDGSRDSTGEVLKSYKGRLQVVQGKGAGSAAAARNAGVEKSVGKWVAFLDDDDEYRPGFLKAMHETLKEVGRAVGLAWCGVRRLDERKGTEEESIWRPSFPNHRSAYLGFIRNRAIGTNCGLTVRRDAFHEVGGFDERLKCAEDTDFLIRTVRKFDFVVVPEILVDVHLHGGPRLTRYGPAMADAYELILHKQRDHLADEPGTRSALEYKAGWLQYRAGRRSISVRHYLAALKARPGSAKGWTALALSVLPTPLGVKIHDAASRLYKKMA